MRRRCSPVAGNSGMASLVWPRMLHFSANARRTGDIPPTITATLALAVSAVVICASARAGDAAPAVFLDERFEDLGRWEEHVFPRVPERSVYETARDDDGTAYLRMSSDGSGSALIFHDVYDIREYPVLEWRWRVDEAVRGVDPLERSGDDYAARIYVFFEYEVGGDLGWRDRVRYNAYRALRGEYPPHSGLNYVWAGVAVEERMYPNPYTDRVMVLVLRDEESGTGEWRTERVDVLRDYRDAFGEDPPQSARLAVMSDSDDSGQSTHARIDYIRIVRE